MPNSPQESLEETISFLEKLLQGVVINYIGFILVYVLFFEKSLKFNVICVAVVALMAFVVVAKDKYTKVPKATKENLLMEKVSFTLSYIAILIVFVGFYLMALQEHYLPEVREHNKKLQIETELDPTWNNDEWATILNPEAVLFASLPMQAACVADCTEASVNFPFDRRRIV